MGNVYTSKSDYYSITIGGYCYFRTKELFEEFPIYLENMVSHEG
jgi:hypothetical protein